MAYSGNPSTNAVDRTRLLVGDISTSTALEILANADYSFFNAQSGNQYVAAQMAARAIAAKVGANGTKKTVGDLTIEHASAADYRSLATHYGRLAAAQITPSAGGITYDDKRDAELDTERVRPAFMRRLFDNQGADDAVRAVLST